MTLDEVMETMTEVIRENEYPEIAAQKIVETLGLDIETMVRTYPAPGAADFEDATVSAEDGEGFQVTLDGQDISEDYNEWFDALPRQTRIVGPYVEEA